MPAHTNIMDQSKIPGIYYFQYVEDKDTKKITVPSIPPFTTWSGYLECPADSPYAKRLVDKCGGVPYKAKLKIEKDLETEPAAEGKPAPKVKVVVKTWEEDWVKGFWTAPVDWIEMAAGRESDTPFSATTYKVTDFPFAVQKA